jgi:oligoendopeptidase F
MREQVLLMRVAALERDLREVAATTFKQHVMLAFLMEVLKSKGTVTDEDVKAAQDKMRQPAGETKLTESFANLTAS